MNFSRNLQGGDQFETHEVNRGLLNNRLCGFFYQGTLLWLKEVDGIIEFTVVEKTEISCRLIRNQSVALSARSSKSSRDLSLVSFWILACTFLCIVGWLLSFAGALRGDSYVLVVLALALVAGALFWKRRGAIAHGIFLKLGWRAKHPLAFLYFCFALLSFLGGLLYPPNNYDALSYRLPRVLHWLAAQKWHWIVTSNPRLNVSATGYEWVSAPILALFSSDRCLFLINTFCFLLMPGLVFGVFTRLGISKRTAWCWMWLLPTGYCYALQAGGIGNDLFGTVFCLAAVWYALKAKDSGEFVDFCLSVFAAALLTGAKATNIPLLLPIVFALIPSVRLLGRRFWWGVLTLGIAAMISFAPSALANLHYTGDWSGDPSNQVQVKIEKPFYGLLGNGMQLVINNSTPPVMPWAEGFSAKFDHLMSSRVFKGLVEHFPRITLVRINELAQEESAGLGMGISCLLLIILLIFLKHSVLGGRLRDAGGAKWLSAAICFSAWVALFGYMAKMGSEAAPRLLATYYPLLIASLLLLPGTDVLIRQRWWSIVCVVAACSALPPLILSPARPLWPAMTFSSILAKRLPNHAFLGRASLVYTVYRERGDNLAPMRKFIPTGTSTIGLVGGGDDPETSLWRPFGARTVLEVLPENQSELLTRCLSTVVVNEEALELRFHCSFDHWLKENHMKVLGTESLLLQVKGGRHRWSVARTADTGLSSRQQYRELKAN